MKNNTCDCDCDNCLIRLKAARLLRQIPRAARRDGVAKVGVKGVSRWAQQKALDSLPL